MVFSEILYKVGKTNTKYEEFKMSKCKINVAHLVTVSDVCGMSILESLLHKSRNVVLKSTYFVAHMDIGR